MTFKICIAYSLIYNKINKDVYMEDFMMESNVTTHAGKRIRERIGVNKKSVQAISDRALQRGLSHSELTGKLKRYIDKLYLKGRIANNIKVYAEKVYLFKNTTLITVISLPTGLKRLAIKLSKNKEFQ